MWLDLRYLLGGKGTKGKDVFFSKVYSPGKPEKERYVRYIMCVDKGREVTLRILQSRWLHSEDYNKIGELDTTDILVVNTG